MDTNWCLHCDRHVDGAAPYCSEECRALESNKSPTPCYPCRVHKRRPSYTRDLDDELIDADVVDTLPSTSDAARWSGKGASGIMAWAHAIPSDAFPPDEQPNPRSCSPSPSATSASTSSASSTSSAHRPPALLSIHHRRVAPTLCMSTPQPARPEPSLPISTPQQHLARHSSASVHSRHSQSFGDASTSVTSLLTSSAHTPATTASSLADDPACCASLVARPALSKRDSVFGYIATHVRAWVSPAPSPSPTPPPRMTPAVPSSVEKGSSRPHRTATSSTINASGSASTAVNASAGVKVTSTTHPRIHQHHRTSPLRVSDEDLTTEAEAEQFQQNEEEKWKEGEWKKTCPYPSPCSLPRSGSVRFRRASGGEYEHQPQYQHPAFLVRGRKGRVEL